MNRKHLSQRRILALDVRSNRIGYAVFEHTNLLEAGIPRFPTIRAATPCLRRVMRRAQAQVLVLRRIPVASSRNCAGTRAIQRSAQQIAKRASVLTAFVSEARIRELFLQEKAGTKYQTASSLARMFPILDWRLPPLRKPWEGEHRNMALFDAVALGVSYLATEPTSANHSHSNDTESFRRSLTDE